METCPLLALSGCGWCGGLVPLGRRRWCSDACARGYRREHTWGPAREAALLAAGGACRVCLTTFNVEVHHDPPAPHYGPGCHHHRDRLIVLCRKHHHERHGTRPRQLTLV